MTRDEIIKTLKCCTSNSCEECPLVDDFDCHNTILKECLEYIAEKSCPKIMFDLPKFDYPAFDVDTTKALSEALKKLRGEPK